MSAWARTRAPSPGMARSEVAWFGVAASVVVCCMIAIPIAGAALIPAGAGLATMAVLVVLLYRMHWLPMAWIAGTPTLFIFPNNILYPILSVLTVERVLFALLVALLAVRVLLGKATIVPLLGVEKWMVAFVVVAGLSLVTTADEKPFAELYRSMVMLVQGFVMPFGALVLVRTMPWRPRHLVHLLRLLSAVGIYLAIAGAIQYFMNITILMPTYLSRDSTDRASGTFANPVEYGAVMLVLCLITLFHYARTNDAAARAFWLVVAMPILGGVMLSKTRAVWGAAALAFALIYKNDRRVRPVLVAGSVLAVAFVIYAELAANRIEQMSPIFSRIALYATAANVFIHNPFVGVGFGTDSFVQHRAAYFTSFGPVTALWAANVGLPHNEFLNILVMTGLAGAIPYALVWISTWKLTRRSRHLADDASAFAEELAPYVRAGVAVVLVNALFADVAFFTYLLTLLFFLLGVLTACRRPTTPVAARNGDRA